MPGLLRELPGPVAGVYEAGPTGYGSVRFLTGQVAALPTTCFSQHSAAPQCPGRQQTQRDRSPERDEAKQDDGLDGVGGGVVTQQQHGYQRPLRRADTGGGGTRTDDAAAELTKNSSSSVLTPAVVCPPATACTLTTNVTASTAVAAPEDTSSTSSTSSAPGRRRSASTDAAARCADPESPPGRVVLVVLARRSCHRPSSRPAQDEKDDRSQQRVLWSASHTARVTIRSAAAPSTPRAAAGRPNTWLALTRSWSIATVHPGLAC